MIDYIDIQGYKSIKKARVELRPINLLIGANGSGKSNFLSLFDFMASLFESRLKEYIARRGGIERLLYLGRKVTEEIQIELSFDTGVNGYLVNLLATDDFYFINHEKLFYQGNPWDIATQGTEGNIISTNLYRAPHIIRRWQGVKKYHFFDTSISSPFNKEVNIQNDANYLYADGGNLAAFLWKIREEHPQSYRRIVSVIQSVAPYFSDFYLEPNEEGYLRLLWRDKHSETIYRPTEFSDGTLRFIALVVLFMQPNLPQTIILDEPELGLHPFAIAKLAGLIKSVSTQGCQCVVATQSIELLNHFSPEDVVAVDNSDEGSLYTRLDSKRLASWLEDYTLGELWQQSIIDKGQLNY